MEGQAAGGRLTLPEDNRQIYAVKYMDYMPTVEELKRELRLDDFEKRDDGDDGDDCR